MATWKAILFIYPSIEVVTARRLWRSKGFQHHLSEDEIADALTSFEAFPGLAAECSNGEVEVVTSVTRISRTLTTVTPMGAGIYWPSPNDTRPELDAIVTPGSLDSVFVLWPQMNLETGEFLPSGGWGLGLGPSSWTNNATYAAVTNATTDQWQRPAIGEIWLHEWLHGVCGYFGGLGIAIPERDADGGESHGYQQSPVSGWLAYYQDLMTGKVNEMGRESGISSEAWRHGSIISRDA